MKHLVLTTIIFLTSVCASAQSALFQKCEDIPGVSSIYISPTMLKHAGVVSDKFNGFSIGELASKIESIEIISAETSAPIQQIEKYFKEVMNSGKYENLMRVKENDEIVNIYLIQLPKGRSQFIIYARGSNELSIITLNGTLTLEDAAKISKKNTRN